MLGRAPHSVDERCAERCAALARGLADCESAGGSRCETERQRWRGFCVTNTACNPTGADPQRAERVVQRECASLRKRLAVCERTMDGQVAPNTTALCQETRKKFRQLCSEDAVAPEALVLGTADAERSAAITQAYREGKHAQPVAEREAGAVASAAAGLLLKGGEESTAARVVREHTFKLVVGAVGLAYAGIYMREASKPASARLSLMHTRVYGQGVALATTVCVVGLAEALDLERRRRSGDNAPHPSKATSSRPTCICCEARSWTPWRTSA